MLFLTASSFLTTAEGVSGDLRPQLILFVVVSLLRHGCSVLGTADGGGLGDSGGRGGGWKGGVPRGGAPGAAAEAPGQGGKLPGLLASR